MRPSCAASATASLASPPSCGRPFDALPAAPVAYVRAAAGGDLVAIHACAVCPYNKDIMLIKRAADIRSSEITDKTLYVNQREFLRASTGTAAAVAVGALGAEAWLQAATPAPHGRQLETINKSARNNEEKPNRWQANPTHNN